MKHFFPSRDMLDSTEQGLTVFFVFLLAYVMMSIPLAGLSYGKLVAQTLVVLGLTASFRLFFRPGLNES